MAILNKKITELDSLSTAQNSDVLAIVNSGESKKITKANFLKELVASFGNYYNKTESDNRYLQSFTETDPVWNSEKANYYTKTEGDNRYLQSFTEADPIFNTWLDTNPLSGFVTGTPWRDEGYLTSFTEEDPIFSQWLLNTPPLYSEADTLQTVTDRGWTTTKEIEASGFKKTGGLSSEFLKADGSSDATAYLTTETDPVFSAWLLATPPLYSETDPVWTSEKANYLTTATASSTYVPYTGANNTVTLGNNSLVVYGAGLASRTVTLSNVSGAASITSEFRNDNWIMKNNRTSTGFARNIMQFVDTNDVANLQIGVYGVGQIIYTTYIGNAYNTPVITMSNLATIDAVNRVGINLSGVTRPQETLQVNGNIWNYDNQKYLLGTGKDMSLSYTGTIGQIKTDEIAPSDLNIACGTDKTIVLNESVWEDLNFDADRSGGPVATRPDEVTINNVFHAEFTSANNQIAGGSQEIPHSYKLSTTMFPHIHIFLKGGESAGTTGVSFTIYWELRQSTGTTTGSVTLSATSAQLGTTAGANSLSIYDTTGFTGNSELCGQLALTIARTGGDAGDIIVTTYGVHYEVDTLGSRSISTK